MRALITGGAGFIGRNFRRRLYAEGWEIDAFDVAPFSVDRRHHGVAGWLQDGRDFFRGSSETRYDLVIHAAAVVGGRRMIEHEPMRQLIDFELDAAFFQWIERARPRHAVYLSSSAVYPFELQTGENWCPPKLRETHVNLRRIFTPDATYGMIKLAGEHMAACALDAGLPIHVVRPFSGYGADQDLTYPFPAFIRRVKQRERPFRIWGDGKQVRDWVHVDDIIGAVMAIVDADYHIPVNIGWGRPTSFIELFELMHDVAKIPKPPVQLLETEPTGVRYRVADTTILNDVYRPKITLEEGIARALRA